MSAPLVIYRKVVFFWQAATVVNEAPQAAYDPTAWFSVFFPQRMTRDLEAQHNALLVTVQPAIEDESFTQGILRV